MPGRRTCGSCETADGRLNRCSFSTCRSLIQAQVIRVSLFINVFSTSTIFKKQLKRGATVSRFHDRKKRSMSTYYNRSDSSIQNTPTTFNSRHPQNPFRSRSNSYEAPERNRENEGLQVDPNGAYPFPSTRAIDSTSKHIVPWFDSRGSSEKQLARGQEGLITTDEDGDENSGHERIWLFKRRTFIVIVSICVVVVICAAVGGAVGGYYRRQSTHSYVQILPCQPFLPSFLPSFLHIH